MRRLASAFPVATILSAALLLSGACQRSGDSPQPRSPAPEHPREEPSPAAEGQSSTSEGTRSLGSYIRGFQNQRANLRPGSRLPSVNDHEEAHLPLHDQPREGLLENERGDGARGDAVSDPEPRSP